MKTKIDSTHFGQLRSIAAQGGTPIFGSAKWFPALHKSLTQKYANGCQHCGYFSQRTWRCYGWKRWNGGTIWCQIMVYITPPQRLVEDTVKALLTQNHGLELYVQPMEDIVQLIRLCLRKCFTFNDRISESTKATLISRAIAKLVVQKLEQNGLTFWAR